MSDVIKKKYILPRIQQQEPSPIKISVFGDGFGRSGDARGRRWWSEFGLRQFLPVRIIVEYLFPFFNHLTHCILFLI